MVRCSECLVPRFVPISSDTIYKVIFPSFVVGGGDGYTMIEQDMLDHHIYGDFNTLYIYILSAHFTRTLE